MGQCDHLDNAAGQIWDCQSHGPGAVAGQVDNQHNQDPDGHGGLVSDRHNLGQVDGQVGGEHILDHDHPDHTSDQDESQ